jgi:hypothetical protein
VQRSLQHNKPKGAAAHCCLGLCASMRAAKVVLHLQFCSNNRTASRLDHSRCRQQLWHMIPPVQPFGINTIRPVPCLCIAFGAHAHIVPFYYKKPLLLHTNCYAWVGGIWYCSTELLRAAWHCHQQILAVWLGLPQGMPLASQLSITVV